MNPNTGMNCVTGKSFKQIFLLIFYENVVVFYKLLFMFVKRFFLSTFMKTKQETYIEIKIYIGPRNWNQLNLECK